MRIIFLQQPYYLFLYSGLFLWSFFPNFIYAEPAGSLDPTFDGDGKVVINITNDDEAFGVVLQTDGKIVVVGKSETDWIVMRLNSDGTLDTTFGSNGYVITDFGGTDEAHGVAIQDDDKIIVAGTGNGNISVARYNPDGSLDTTFNGTGTVTTIFTEGSQGAAIALQADNKIIAAGRSGSGPVTLALVRYNPDGSLDTTFNGTGRVETDINGEGTFSQALSVALQADGKIVAVGEVFVSSQTQFATVRYNPDGSLDTTFNGTGVATLDLSGGADSAVGVAIQIDGKIIVAGQAGLPSKCAVARYNTDGSLDTAGFGTPNGFVLTTVSPSGSTIQGVALQGDGKIVVVGSAEQFAVIRYTTNGSLDTSFGVGGITSTNFDGINSLARAVVIQPDEKIVVTGRSLTSEDNSDIVLARFIGIGTVDPCKLLIGSDTILNLFTTQQLVAQGGRLAKLALLNGGFGLCGDATFASCFPVAGSICLECFTLTLENDLIMHDVSYIGSAGNIIGDGHILDLAKSVSIIPTLVCTSTTIQPAELCPNIEWGNLIVRLNGDVILNDTSITFTGESAIRGNGHTLTLNNAELIVGSDATLLFDNVIINSVHDGVIECIDNSSAIQLYDTQWLLDNDLTFSKGHFDVLGTFDIIGDGYSFIYQSPIVSTIDKNGIMILNSGLTFEYDPSIAARDLLQLIDSTSQLILNGATLHSTRTGLQLTRGSLMVDQKSFIFSEALVKAEGIMFGDGINVENNLNVHIAPAAVLEVTSGFLVQEDA